MALPDVGLFHADRIGAASETTSRPSGDFPGDCRRRTPGFGEAVNVERTVAELERAGAAAIQLEDQVLPKRCGHLSGKTLVERT